LREGHRVGSGERRPREEISGRESMQPAGKTYLSSDRRRALTREKPDMPDICTKSDGWRRSDHTRGGKFERTSSRMRQKKKGDFDLKDKGWGVNESVAFDNKA